MIAKCVVLLAAFAQINAYVCNSNYASPVVVSGVESSRLIGSSNILGSGLVRASGIVGSNFVGSSSGFSNVAASSVSGASGTTTATTRTVVAKGKYPVALDNTGPVPDNRVPVTTAHVRTPVQEKPLVRLSANIPAPRTVAHSCTCYKQVLRPRVHDQYITVPTVQRYLETTHTPVIENIHYEAVPVNAPETAAAVTGSQLTSSAFQIASASSGAQILPVTAAAVESGPLSSVQSVQAFPLSSVQSLPISSIQSASVPTVQSVQAVPMSSGQFLQAIPVSSQTLQSVQTVPVRSISGLSEVSNGFNC